MKARWPFLAAYACSGLSGLAYQVAWTRLLTLQMGHTTAAAATVVASFMGGLAAGASLGGRFVSRLTVRQALCLYAGLELLVALIALAVPLELNAMKPLLAASYRDGTPGWLFPLARLFSSLIVVFVPALALGATFPVALQCVAPDPRQSGGSAGALYAANTAGAAAGALAAGFVLMPRIGISGTTLVGVAASALAIAVVLILARRAPPSPVDEGSKAAASDQPSGPQSSAKARGRRKQKSGVPSVSVTATERAWLVPLVVALTGFAGLACEITWTRVFALIVGPTTYAFAATVTAVIAGLACGSAVGAWIAINDAYPSVWLALALAASAAATTSASILAGRYVPRLIAEQMANASVAPGALLIRQSILVAGLLVPPALGLGAAFPLALALVKARGQSPTAGLAQVYAVNTVAAVAGSLTAGFITIPVLGLQRTLLVVSGSLLLAAVIVLVWGEVTRRGRIFGLLGSAAALVFILVSPPWDRNLLASGVYKYAARVPRELDLEAALKAGALLYYREGATATVSVRRLSGTLSLAIDGKVDASNLGDMLTQKALAHLPLLLHPDPHEICIIGLGSGVTLGSALTHPVNRADVVEISPEVVEASRYFAADNRHALDDSRTHLVRGDGRTHLALSSRKYDVIISEPSNPWIAGVAALFTQEFFLAARERLAPGGLICQWAHTYDISGDDLRSIVATFSSVFPNATMWMVGDADLLLVASTAPLDAQLANIGLAWSRPGVADDLATVSALEPFAFWSLFAGGPGELTRYASGTRLQRDDRMALEFSGPRAVSGGTASGNASELRQLLQPGQRPAVISRSFADARAVQWRNRAAMLAPADGYISAFGDYVTAVTLDPTDPVALQGLVKGAVATHREAQALDLLKSWSTSHPQVSALLVATSKLLAAMGSFDEAVAVAQRAVDVQPGPFALEQLASLFADLGDADRLEGTVKVLERLAPSGASTLYYAAAARFLRGQVSAAADLAQQAVARDAHYAAAYNLLGASYASAGDRSKARAAFEAALRIDPRDSVTYVNLGLLELSESNRTAAAADFAEALALDPESQPARNGLRDANVTH